MTGRDALGDTSNCFLQLGGDDECRTDLPRATLGYEGSSTVSQRVYGWGGGGKGVER
jgi:hypothetical protein